MQEKLTRLVGPLTLLEWGGILLYFYFSGRVHSLLHPSFRPQVLIAGILLTLCGILLLVTRKQKAACGCGDEETCLPEMRSTLAGSVIFPLMLLVPLGVATLSSRDVYGANAVQMRGTVTSAAALPGLADKFASVPKTTPPPAAPTDVEPALPTASGAPDPNAAAGTSDASAAADYFKPNVRGHIEVNVADLLYAADEPTLRSPFQGKSAELIGQFMPADRNNPNGNRFKLVRMFMVCCAADAQPVSVLIELPKDGVLPKDVNEMVWTRVVGEITFPTEAGRVIPVVKASKVESSAPPEETMLY